MRKTLSPRFAVLLIFLLAASSAVPSVFAQASVKIGGVSIDTTLSPQFTLTGKKKTFKSKKNWLEAEVRFQVSASKKPKDGYLPDAIEVEDRKSVV